VFISDASRGIGLGLTRGDRVFAVCPNPQSSFEPQTLKQNIPIFIFYHDELELKWLEIQRVDRTHPDSYSWVLTSLKIYLMTIILKIARPSGLSTTK
jgi:hypothetical protein